VERKDNKREILILPKIWLEKDDKVPSKGYCEVKDAYPSCQHGGRREEGKYVTLEMKYEPLGLSSAVAAPNEMNEFIISDYRITRIAEILAEGEVLTGMVFDLCAGNTMEKQAEGFLQGTSSYDEEPLKYGYFISQTGNGRRPLLIWLHGGREGGEEPATHDLDYDYRLAASS
jgi:hypothetical protein